MDRSEHIDALVAAALAYGPAHAAFRAQYKVYFKSNPGIAKDTTGRLGVGWEVLDEARCVHANARASLEAAALALCDLDAVGPLAPDVAPTEPAPADPDQTAEQEAVGT